MTDPHLISVDELRAAGALDVPPAWRKSLTTERPQRTKSLFDDEDDEQDRHAESSIPHETDVPPSSEQD